MTSYAEKERARYWPVSLELMAQYKDGTHTTSSKAGTLVWYQNGQRYRDGDKPAYIDVDGTLYWYQNGLIHRNGDKPTYINVDGTLRWYQNGKRHRIYGPAVIYPDGRFDWWINAKNITHEVNEWLNGEEWQGTPLQIFEFQLRFT